MSSAKTLVTDKVAFSRALLSWFDQHQRAMPWRKTKDPYAILVSEIMLQQTQVKTVIPYYLRFLEQFPTPSALASAPESAVLKCWQGLGYYRRARHLQAAAQQIESLHNGHFPSDKASIDHLKGVGAYTSAAVASIAFDLPFACVDGNVLRVLTRLTLWDLDIAQAKNVKTIGLLAQGILDQDRPGDFNQAMMELGATVCTPRNASCLTCPVSEHCQSNLQGQDPHARPVKTKKLKVGKAEKSMGFFFFNHHFILAKRPSSGLMADMWELPAVELNKGTLWPGLFTKTPQFRWQRPKPFQHKFSHLHVQYHLSVWHLTEAKTFAEPLSGYESIELVTLEQAQTKPLTRVCSELLKELQSFVEGDTQCINESSMLPGM